MLSTALLLTAVMVTQGRGHMDDAKFVLERVAAALSDYTAGTSPAQPRDHVHLLQKSSSRLQAVSTADWSATVPATAIPGNQPSLPGQDKVADQARLLSSPLSSSSAPDAANLANLNRQSLITEDTPAISRAGISLLPSGTNVSHGQIKAEMETDLESQSFCETDFTGGGGPELCFCKLAENHGCAHFPCTCPQGCGPTVVARHGQTVTFLNEKLAGRCGPQSALAVLTITRSYFSNIQTARVLCPSGIRTLLAEMLAEGFLAYQSHSEGPVRQCIHSARFVSTSWFHLHTFCYTGFLDNMPSGLAWCEHMHGLEDVARLVQSVWEWSSSQHLLVEEDHKLESF